MIKNVNTFNIKKRFDNEAKYFFSIKRYLINGHHAKLRKIKEEEELKEIEREKERLFMDLNKNQKPNVSKMSRKTQIFLVDSDGDVIVGTEDELDNFFTESSQKQNDEKESNSRIENFDFEKSPDFNNAEKKYLNKDDPNLNNLMNNNNFNPHPNNILINDRKYDKKEKENNFCANDYNSINNYNNMNLILDNVVLRFLDESKIKILEAYSKSVFNDDDISDAIELLESLHINKQIDSGKKAVYIEKLENLLEIISFENHKTLNACNQDSYTMKLNQQIGNLIDDCNMSKFLKLQKMPNKSKEINEFNKNEKGNNKFLLLINKNNLAKDKESKFFKEEANVQNNFFTKANKQRKNSFGYGDDFKKELQLEKVF